MRTAVTHWAKGEAPPNDENAYSPLGRETVKKLGGRASWRAIAPVSPCPMRLGGSLALPICAGF